MNVNDIQFNINYTLDMTTQAAVFNRISLAAKLNLGDRGRADRQKRIEKLYIEGLRLYALGELDEAVEVWNAALDLDKRFDPAIEGVRTALYTIQIQQEIRKLQILEDSEAQAGGTDP
jgi:tetratricopeptide (TPR) repeat protein